ncbi:MAG: trigger factor [Clostridia bacterium]|nr:trigger factor [Clostridia bacterium]
MQYNLQPAEKSQVKLTLTLDQSEWEQAIRQAYEKNKAKFNVQGFRKGHVPFSVIVGQYGKEFFYEDAINLAITEHYPEILKKEADKLNVVGDPQFSLDDVGENGVTVTAMIPVMPEVAIGAYTGIKVEKTEYNVTDADVDADVEKLLDRNSKEQSVTDRPCQKGDVVVIDYSGSVDGVKFDGGTASGQRLELGSNTFIPGFEDQVAGMTVGEEKDINVTFPENYTDELKGKAAVFAIKLHEIIEKVRPELTDEFVKDATGEESVSAYKEKVRANMEKENKTRADNENEDKLLAAIAEKTEVVIPDAMIEDEITNMVKQFSYRLMYQGMKFEDYLKYTGQTEEKIRASYKDTATDRVKKQLIVNTVIEKENIVATDEEVDAKVAEQAASVGKEVDAYRKGMDDRQFEYIKNSIVVDKLFKFLTENNEFYTAEKK